VNAGTYLFLGLALLVLLTMAALISAAETAMTAASRGRMHQLEREGDRAAARVNRLIGDQETMIGAILLSNNVFNILASALTTAVLSAAFPGALGVLSATALMTVLIVVFGEILPKTLALTRAESAARVLSLPTVLVVKVFGPLANGAQWIVRQTLRPFGVKLSMETDVLAAREEIRGAVEYHHSEGMVEEGDRRMLGGVLDLGEIAVSEIMVHRKNIVMLDADLPARELVEQALASPHTRMPLYRDEPDNIVGVLHARDLLRALARAEGAVDSIEIRGPGPRTLVHPRHHQRKGPAERLSAPAEPLRPGGRRVRRADGVGDARGHPGGDRRRHHRRARPQRPGAAPGARRLSDRGRHGDHPGPQPGAGLGPAGRGGGDHRRARDPRRGAIPDPGQTFVFHGQGSSAAAPAKPDHLAEGLAAGAPAGELRPRSGA
jgi:CBS domain-containing protein